MPSNLTPPQPPLKWTHSADEIKKIVKEAIQAHRQLEDAVAQIPPEQCSFESVFLRLAFGNSVFDSDTELTTFYRNVSPSQELREASNAVDALRREYGVTSSMRVDVYKAKAAAEKNAKSSGEWEKLSPEAQRLAEEMLLDGKRAGLDLPEAQRKELEVLKKELEQRCLDFSTNYAKENGKITFTFEELEGVPPDVVSGYTKRTEDSRELYDITFKEPDISPVFKYAQNPETRRLAWEAYQGRLPINIPILEKMLALRRKITKLLGYPTWADYITEVKMTGSARAVQTFLDDLEQKLRPLGLRERETLLALKREGCGEKGLPCDDILRAWDFLYYDRLSIEKSLDLDDNLVKEYFPVSVVVPAIMDIYRTLLSVRFEEIKGEVWHPDVQQFAVWDKDATDESGFHGYCYLDLLPREHKYPHAAVWTIFPGYKLEDGKRQYPTVAMVANLAKPTSERPALMTHYDAVTFFHEMGHAFHGLLSRTEFSRFHGTNVARDFVEAPSQMLENWCWEPEVLEKMSSHFESKAPLSAELIQKILKSRYVNIGLSTLRQIFFGKFDMKVHTDQEPTDYTELWNTMRDSITLVDASGSFRPGQATFDHLAGEYDAGYYGYMYSLVFAADMYATVFRGAPLDPARGRRYRDKILKVGGSRKEMESLKDFLGRPPNSDAFMKEIFGSAQTASL